MKPRTMERLDLLAAYAERRLLDDISRHQAALAQVQAQRQMLAAYRSRLAQSWRGGAAVTAGQARSAGHFVAASQAAETQIDHAEARARHALAAALEALATTQARRQSLEDARQKAARATERGIETRREQAVPWRAPGPKGGA